MAAIAGPAAQDPGCMSMAIDRLDGGEPLFDFPTRVPPRQFYVICTTGRCGSSWLTTLLWRTGVCGAPMEYFNFNDVMWRQARRWGVSDLTAYMDELLSRRTGPNGVFGVKCSFPQFHFLKDLSTQFGKIKPVKYVYLDRRDKIEQAVSFAMARQTGRWVSGHKAVRAPAYDAGLITGNLRQAEAHRTAWKQWFARSRIEPLQIMYEELRAAPDETVKAVQKYLGVDGDVAGPFQAPPPEERFAQPRKAIWATRYRREQKRG
jgi:LPS sulfotransferase NodH